MIVYIDGFNLYYGLKDSGFKRYYWLDLQAIARAICRSSQVLVTTKYFTSRVKGGHPRDSQTTRNERDASRVRQSAFLDALSGVGGLEIFEGHFLAKRRRCRSCPSVWYDYEEKKTDVLIATHMLVDACSDRFDLAIVVSGDTDLIPPLEQVESFYGKKVLVVFPPNRASADQKTLFSCYYLKERDIKKCQLPNPCKSAAGRMIPRPAEWV